MCKPVQVEFGEICSLADEQVAYTQLKDIIRNCLDLDFLTRTSGLQVQKCLFNIMQQMGWSHDLGCAESC